MATLKFYAFIVYEHYFLCLFFVILVLDCNNRCAFKLREDRLYCLEITYGELVTTFYSAVITAAFLVIKLNVIRKNKLKSSSRWHGRFLNSSGTVGGYSLASIKVATPGVNLKDFQIISRCNLPRCVLFPNSVIKQQFNLNNTIHFL